MRSEREVHKQLVKHYKQIKWDKYLVSSHQSVTFSISLRHSLHSISDGMRSKIEVYKQLVKHYKQIKLDKYLVFTFRAVMFCIYLRHSPHSTSHIIKSAHKVQKQLVKQCEQIEWDKYLVLFISISQVLYLSQTLTTLDLRWNEIGERGAQAIGEALKTNQVG